MKRIAIYLAVTFGATWGLWITAGILTGAYAGGDTNGVDGSFSLVVAIGMFGPLLGALVTNATSPREQRLSLGIKPHVRKDIRFYLLAWFVPPALSIVGAMVFFLVFPSLFDASAPYIAQQLAQYGGVSDDQMTVIVVATIIEALTFAPFINMFFAFGEETGWRGMLLPLLRERFSFRQSTLIIGVIWGLWHAPITCLGHNYGTGYPGFPITGILSMIVFCTAVGILLAWLREKTNSIWPCALAHGSFNASAGLGVMFCTAGTTLLGPSIAGLVGGIPLIVLAALVWLKQR